jgi:hypothetical protein
LAHLRHLRLEKIRQQLSTSHQHSNICEALRYQLASLQTFKGLFGRPLIEAMNDLQKKPILLEPSIRDLDALDLDRIISLIPSDIRTFVPYFKRVAPTSEELNLRLEAWSHESGQLLVNALGRSLSEINQISIVLELRKQLYTLLLPSYFSAAGGAHLQAQISKALNERIRFICHAQSARLDRCTQMVIEATAEQNTGQPLWDADLALSNLDAGGHKFIRKVGNRHLGYGASLSKASKLMTKWAAAAHDTAQQLEDSSGTRWRDILEEPDEDGEDEAASLIKTLNEQDPQAYKQTLQSSLQEAALKHETVLAEASDKVIADQEVMSRAIFVLRAIRLSISALQSILPRDTRLKRFEETTPQLQQVIADKISLQLAEKMQRSSQARPLAKGVLPENMPSPRAFLALRNLSRIMVGVGGTDLWTPALIVLVKSSVRFRVFDPEKKSLYLENEFDEAYIGLALGSDTRDKIQDDLKGKEVAKAASEYWTRTRLLFGMLS